MITLNDNELEGINGGAVPLIIPVLALVVATGAMLASAANTPPGHYAFGFAYAFIKEMA